MTLIELLVLLIIAGICGAVGQSIAGKSRGGWLTAIGVGYVGALLGTWLSRLMGLPELFAINIAGTSFPIVWSIAGGAIFVALLSMLRGGR